MEQLILVLIVKVLGEVNVFGLKSLLNCVLLLVVLVEGDIELINLLDSDDILYMFIVLIQLGIQYMFNENKICCMVKGNGGVFKVVELLELFLGNVGMVMCFLCVVLVVSEVYCVLMGELCMEECFIGDLVDGFCEVNVDISYLKNDGFLFFQIKGKILFGGEMFVDGSVFSQFLIVLLMVVFLFVGDVIICIKGELVLKFYIDIILDIMVKFGVFVENDNY